jgi:hypothetical protein
MFEILVTKTVSSVSFFANAQSLLFYYNNRKQTNVDRMTRESNQGVTETLCKNPKKTRKEAIQLSRGKGFQARETTSAKVLRYMCVGGVSCIRSKLRKPVE